MGTIRYLSAAEVIALHAEILRRTGFPTASVRDMGLLESAAMRPQMAAHYEHADWIRQASLLAVGISQAQAFLDGNKRAAFIACIAFLRLNGIRLQIDAVEIAHQLEAVADHQGDLESATLKFETWLRTHTA